MSRELVKTLRMQSGLSVCWEDIEPIVTELQERKILIDLSNRLLSLAVKEPYSPLPKREEAATGYIDFVGFLRSKRKQRNTQEPSSLIRFLSSPEFLRSKENTYQ